MIKCTFEDGGQGFLRHTTTSTAVLNQDKTKILLIKRAPHLSNGGLYGCPGGYVDLDETIAEGAAREVREETGYEVSNLQLMKIKDDPHRPNEEKQNIELAYFAIVGEKVGEGDVKESTEIKWFDLDKVPPKEQWAYDHYDNLALLKNFV